jgi:hypothetical protein
LANRRRTWHCCLFERRFDRCMEFCTCLSCVIVRKNVCKCTRKCCMCSVCSNVSQRCCKVSPESCARIHEAPLSTRVATPWELSHVPESPTHPSARTRSQPCGSRIAVVPIRSVIYKLWMWSVAHSISTNQAAYRAANPHR